MLKNLLKLSKKAYTLDAIRSALLSVHLGGCQIADENDQWVIDLNAMKAPIHVGEVLRRIDEFSLRASLEQRFAVERDAIVALAFGRE